MRERSVEIFDEDRSRGGIEHDLGPEAFADQLVAHHHGGDQHLLVLDHLPALDFQCFAQWQELRVVLDIGHERVHVVRGVCDGMLDLEEVHEGSTMACA